MGVPSYCISCCPLSREQNAALGAARPPNDDTGSRGRKAARGLFIASIHMEEKMSNPYQCSRHVSLSGLHELVWFIRLMLSLLVCFNVAQPQGHVHLLAYTAQIEL